MFPMSRIFLNNVVRCGITTGRKCFKLRFFFNKQIGQGRVVSIFQLISLNKNFIIRLMAWILKSKMLILKSKILILKSNSYHTGHTGLLSTSLELYSQELPYLVQLAGVFFHLRPTEENKVPRIRQALSFKEK